MERIPVISLWQPWCFWVALGWKKIETRTHSRFANLVGKTIGIHAAQKWDNNWLAEAREYLTNEQIHETMDFLHIGGIILCTAKVLGHRTLTNEDSQDALIDCGGEIKRYGLILEEVNVIEGIPCKGRQGVFYADVPSR